jgi:hypothetical protein
MATSHKPEVLDKLLTVANGAIYTVVIQPNVSNSKQVSGTRSTFGYQISIYLYSLPILDFKNLFKG